MNIAITKSCGQKFALLTGQLHDIVIWEKENALCIIYILNKETTNKIKESSLANKIKLSNDKFANPESFNSVFTYTGTSEYLLSFFRKHFNSNAEKVPRFSFPEKINPNISF